MSAPPEHADLLAAVADELMLVREGIDGFKVAVTLPPPGTGLDLAADYLTDHLNYSAYMAHPCMATAVYADACTRAFITLIEQPDLRRRHRRPGR